MAIIKCPECQNEVSDKATACPKCGCPITNALEEKTEQVNEQEKENTKNSKKKVVKTVCIVAGIVIVLCVAVFVMYYIANKEQISISKAEEYTANQQYEKVIEVLEKYKDSDKAKQMYDDAVFLTSEEGKFIIDFAQGLEERWEYDEINNDAESGKKLVNFELDKLKKYENITFDNATFNEKAHAYIDALNLQMSATDYLYTDYIKCNNLWDEGYKKRSTLITYFLNNYPVPIDDKYTDVKLEFQSAAQGIKAQQEFDDKIDMMIHKDKFVQTKSDYGWKTYEITVMNETDKTFNYFGLYVNCLDADGKILSQEYTNQVNGYAPGQTATFEFSTDKNPESFTWTANYDIQ